MYTVLCDGSRYSGFLSIREYYGVYEMFLAGFGTFFWKRIVEKALMGEIALVERKSFTKINHQTD